MKPPLYILREVWTETYNCPDEGLQNICETYADISISSNKKKLDEIAEQLNIGMVGKYYSERENKRLRLFYSAYDCMKDSMFLSSQ